MKKTNKNFLYNLAYQLLSFLLPLITIPYVSRVLGVDNVGIYSFTYSIVSYFMLASMLGINNYGSREIAKVSENQIKRSKKFFSIYILQLFFTFLMILFFIVFVSFLNYNYKSILLIQSLYLLSCAFDINWYFFGMEKFKITISRNIIIKLLSLILIFIFVKTKNDLWIYTIILSLSTLISQLYLWFFMKREIKLVKVNKKEVFSNLSKCLILFIPVIAYSIYRITDKTMIGVLSDVTQLGNYESAEKIINIPLSIITALGTVMLPHMSNIKENEFSKKISSTFKLCFFMLFPIFVGLFIVAKDFSFVFFGEEFTFTYKIIRILLITILFSGITNVIRNNYLIPQSRDKIYVKSTIIGAVVNIIINLLLIKKFGAFGACVGTILAEFFVMFYQVIKTKEKIDYKLNLKLVIPFFIKSLFMGCFVIAVNIFMTEASLLKLIIQAILGIVIYFILNFNYIKYEFLGRSKK